MTDPTEPRVKAVARKRFPILGAKASIDWQLVEDHGKQAQANHYQTVERLAGRGGLSWSELHAVLHNRPWQKMDENTAIVECRALEARYLAAIAALDAQPASDLIEQVARLICGGGQDEMIAAATPLGEPCDYPAWMLEQLTARSIYAIIRKAVLADAADALAAKDAENAALRKRTVPRLQAQLKTTQERNVDALTEIARLKALLDEVEKRSFTYAYAKGFQIAEETSRSCMGSIDDAWADYLKLGTDHAHD